MKAPRYSAMVLGVLLLAGAACSSGDVEEVGSGGDVGSAGEVDPDATFRYGSVLPITDLDPHHAPGAGTDTWLFPVYDRLVHVDPAGNALPGLATAWEFNEDATELSMTLREGVTFTDGEPFDAEAVKANIERGQALEASSVAGALSVVDAVRVDGEHTVTFELAQPSSTLPLVLSGKPGAMVSPAAFDENLSETMVGAGMYELESYEPGVSATFVRNDDYWDSEKVGVARLEFTVITSSLTRLNALQSGEIDATFLDAPQVAQAEQRGITVESAETAEFIHLQLDRTRSEFGDQRVRQALNHAIDREAIVENLVDGMGEAAVQPFPPSLSASNPDMGPEYYAYDPDKARDLLAEAGLADGFEFEMVVLNIDPYPQLAEILQAQFNEVGIRTTLRQTPDVSGECYVGQECDAMPILWTGRIDPAITASALFTSTGSSNPGRHTVAEVELLLAETATIADEAARATALQDLSTAITEQALDVVLYFPYQNAAFTEGVQGFLPWLSGKPEFRDVTMTN